MNTTETVIPTREDVERLKHSWENDPCWDLSLTQGFVAYREELEAFENRKKAEWERDRLSRIAAKAQALNCSEALAERILHLEWRLEQLEKRLDGE